MYAVGVLSNFKFPQLTSICWALFLPLFLTHSLGRTPKISIATHTTYSWRWVKLARTLPKISLVPYACGETRKMPIRERASIPLTLNHAPLVTRRLWPNDFSQKLQGQVYWQNVIVVVVVAGLMWRMAKNSHKSAFVQIRRSHWNRKLRGDDFGGPQRA